MIDVPVGGERDLSYVAAFFCGGSETLASEPFELISHIAHYLTRL